MVDGQNTDPVLISKLLDSADDLIVAGVAVSLASGLPNLLHGVNDNQLRVGVFLYEILKLLVKTVSDFVAAVAKCTAVSATPYIINIRLWILWKSSSSARYRTVP